MTSRGRLEREARTVGAMLRIHCQGVHAAGEELCAGCRELGSYADERLARCPYGEEKPTCVNCPIHCYRPEMRARMKAVMAYAGPRMLLRHPVLAVRHQLDGRAPVPERPGKVRTTR